MNQINQFGEGGAGAFSDGKLATRIKDHRCTFVLDEIYKGSEHHQKLNMKVRLMWEQIF